MGNRADCPVCGSHSSNVLYDIQQGHDCSICGCKHSFLVEYQEILLQKENFTQNKQNKILIEQHENLTQENFKLRNKLEKLRDIFGYEFQSEFMDSIKKTIEILDE